VSWALVLLAPPDELEVLAAELFELGALGVELQEPGMPLMPGTPELPAGRGRAIAHFDVRSDAAVAAQTLGTEPPVEIAAQDWSVAWRAHHRAMKVGPRSWVVPPWEQPPGDTKPPAASMVSPSRVVVTIDPGMAFGTGSHPTTSLCLEACDELLAARPGADVLDVGTGSGVIALLAVRLGAGRVVGTENDLVALQAARDGAAQNGIAPDRIEWLMQDPSEVPGQFGIVIANILLNTLEELAPQIAAKVAPGGRLVLSGLLAEQGDAAERAYLAQGLRAVSRRERDGWIRVEMERA
jgi:ribosomal protein L11 methyltransferase